MDSGVPGLESEAITRPVGLNVRKKPFLLRKRLDSDGFGMLTAPFLWRQHLMEARRLVIEALKPTDS